MGHHRPKRHHPTTKSHTLPSSPTHSSSSSDFEFTISASNRKSSSTAAAADLCPADELFYKGKLLPLHPSTRLSMVRTLLLSSASTSSASDTTTTASRDSTASHSSSIDDCLSSGRPSSVADNFEFKRLTNNVSKPRPKPPSKYFSLPKIFRKEQKPLSTAGAGAAKRLSSNAKEMICRYLKKVRPLYEKLSPKQKISTPPPSKQPPSRNFRLAKNTLRMAIDHKDQESNHLNKEDGNLSILHSFSGNLRLYPRARSYISSCPSSMRSSPSHGKSGFGHGFGCSQTGRAGMQNSDASSMEELQNAIQGAIAHCKNSMLQNMTVVSDEI